MKIRDVCIVAAVALATSLVLHGVLGIGPRAEAENDAEGAAPPAPQAVSGEGVTITGSMVQARYGTAEKPAVRLQAVNTTGKTLSVACTVRIRVTPVSNPMSRMAMLPQEIACQTVTISLAGGSSSTVDVTAANPATLAGSGAVLVTLGAQSGQVAMFTVEAPAATTIQAAKNTNS